MKDNIPKVIHYCWFGGAEFNPLIKDCIITWRDKLPDYQFVKWDESNAPMNHPVIKKAIDQKKWAFASDYMRLKALFDHGGVYLDTDMEVVKDFSAMLKHSLFLGYESDEHVGVGILGAKKNHPIILKAIKIMEERVKNNMPFISIPNILKEAFEVLPEPGIERNGVIAYPKEVFYPYNPYVMDRKQMLASDIKNDTYAIHHWDGSWVTNSLSDRIVRVVSNLLGRYGLL